MVRPIAALLAADRPRSRTASIGDALFRWPLSPHEREQSAVGDPLSPLFDDASNFDLRHLTTLADVSRLSAALRRRGYRVVLTNGSFDLLHCGHSMYLERARSFGDFLIVGVDSDDKVRERKGPNRPVVPELERLQMLCFQRAVGAVFLKRPEHKQWTLARHAKPDVLVVTAETYSSEGVERLRRRLRCQVEVLDRMATVSTTARVRAAQMAGAVPLF